MIVACGSQTYLYVPFFKRDLPRDGLHGADGGLLVHAWAGQVEVVDVRLVLHLDRVRAGLEGCHLLRSLLERDGETRPVRPDERRRRPSGRTRPGRGRRQRQQLERRASSERSTPSSVGSGTRVREIPSLTTNWFVRFTKSPVLERTERFMSDQERPSGPDTEAADHKRMTRLGLLRRGAVAGAAAATAGSLVTVEVGSAEAATPPPLQFLTEWEFDYVTAMAETIWPTDENGPGARVAGVGHYIDGQLAGSWGQGHRFYLNGPFFTPADTGHGWQIPMTPADVYRAFLPGFDAYVRQTFGNPYTALSGRPADDRADGSPDRERPRSRSAARRPSRAATSTRCSGRTCSRGCSPTRRTVGTSDMVGWKQIGFPGDPMRRGDPYHEVHLQQEDVPLREQAAAADAEVREARRRVGAAATGSKTPANADEPDGGSDRGQQEGRCRDRRGRLGRRDHRRRADEGRAQGGRARARPRPQRLRLPGRPRRAALRDPLRPVPERGERDLDVPPQPAARPRCRCASSAPGCPGRGSAARACTGTARPGGSTRATSRSSTNTIDRYGASAIPANMSIQDWGITYDELEPYYDKFEYMAGIAGQGRQPQGPADRRRQRLRGPALARVPGRAAARHAADGAVQGGDAEPRLPPVHRRRPPTCRSRYKNPDGIERGQCTYCGFCERFGCEVGAKADPTVTVLPVAQKTGQVQDRSTTRTRSRSRTTARTRRASSTTTRWGACRSSPPT